MHLSAFFIEKIPKKLSDTEWCRRVAEMDYCLEYNGTRIPKIDGE
jgi:hypothetical protein